jgi:hypothetical protein
VFDAFGLQVTYDKTGASRSAPPSPRPSPKRSTTQKTSREEVSSVAQRDIAGARFVPRSDARILQRYSLAA